MERITGVSLLMPNGSIMWMPDPSRHHHLLKKAREDGIPPMEYMSAEQGFITTTGRHVDRKEALTIAIGSGQVVSKLRAVPDLDELFSEDLW